MYLSYFIYLFIYLNTQLAVCFTAAFFEKQDGVLTFDSFDV